MEDKIAKEIAVQLKRIADALEKSNKNSETSEKRNAVIGKLQEKNLKADLREKLNLDQLDYTPRPSSPRFKSEDGSL
jgi:hypothetical protein